MIGQQHRDRIVALLRFSAADQAPLSRLRPQDAIVLAYSLRRSRSTARSTSGSSSTVKRMGLAISVLPFYKGLDADGFPGDSRTASELRTL